MKSVVATFLPPNDVRKDALNVGRKMGARKSESALVNESVLRLQLGLASAIQTAPGSVLTSCYASYLFFEIKKGDKDRKNYF